MKMLAILWLFGLLGMLKASTEPNEILLILSNEGASAAITVASKSLGHDNSHVYAFSEPLSPACSPDDRVTRCLNLSIIPTGSETWMAIVPLATKIGVQEFWHSGKELVQVQVYEKSMTVENCTLLDIVVHESRVVAPCIDISQKTLHICEFQLNHTHLDSSNASCSRVLQLANTSDLDYRYVTNFLYSTVYEEYFFAIHGDVYSSDLDSENASHYFRGNLGSSDCERLEFTGNDTMLAYCGSHQAVEFDIGHRNHTEKFSLNQTGIPFACPTSDERVVVRDDDDGKTTLTYGNDIELATNGSDFIYGKFHECKLFFYVDSDQGIGVLDVSSQQSNIFVNSSQTSYLVLFEGPYIVALREEQQALVLYGPSFQSVLYWEGDMSPSAVGVIVLVSPDETPRPDVTLGLAVRLGVGLPLLLCLFTCAAVGIICCYRNHRLKRSSNIRRHHMDLRSHSVSSQSQSLVPNPHLPSSQPPPLPPRGRRNPVPGHLRTSPVHQTSAMMDGNKMMVERYCIASHSDIPTVRRTHYALSHEQVAVYQDLNREASLQTSPPSHSAASPPPSPSVSTPELDTAPSISQPSEPCPPKQEYLPHPNSLGLGLKRSCNMDQHCSNAASQPPSLVPNPHLPSSQPPPLPPRRGRRNPVPGHLRTSPVHQTSAMMDGNKTMVIGRCHRRRVPHSDIPTIRRTHYALSHEQAAVYQDLDREASSQTPPPSHSAASPPPSPSVSTPELDTAPSISQPSEPCPPKQEYLPLPNYLPPAQHDDEADC